MIFTESLHASTFTHNAGNPEQGGSVEPHHRVTSVSVELNKHRTVLANKHMSLKLRLIFAVVTPTMPSCFDTFALTKA